MLRFHNFDVVFAEIPGETTLAINLTGCPNRCPGCHSPHLQGSGGEVLDDDALRVLLGRYGRSVTCVCFMGGDGEPAEVARLAGVVRRTMPQLRVGWYSGRSEFPAGVAAQAFDYVKLGPWVEALGPLSSPSTNQRFYRVGSDGTMEDRTETFRRRP
ncbi:MAG: anaerobic ribonucleoside-triphosphate reductase activating protein [Alistipes sp.]|jgi:anaerobic ribonucleoside-triphosphate reductase activating protein|uniref:anaerobic ribonucleoside-triphosphate reductase activating protein n=1 Tax=uncultured Alistipes sp. TaxID=538949 RepID=UPI0023D4C78C|nr:anaerobic ribonucleoside-triphosphate reductase activating protein [uncultured Alistipes sp.]MDE6827668.1 anaerobic ribonucleoside-triphosphate reductase activating protein [Alistipes sp.]